MTASILSFSDVLKKFRREAFSERDKGARFELLMKKYLLSEPTYEGRFKQIWLWNEFPYRKDFSGKDTGIDLVAQTVEGDYWLFNVNAMRKMFILIKQVLIVSYLHQVRVFIMKI